MINRPVEHNLLLRDTFTGSSGDDLETEHSPDFGPDWTGIFDGNNTGVAELNASNQLIAISGQVMIMGNPCGAARQIKVNLETNGTPSLVYCQLVLRLPIDSIENPQTFAFPAGTLGIQLPGGSVNNINVNKTPGGSNFVAVTGNPAPTPTVDLATDNATFILQDFGRFIRGWFVGDEANSLFEYDTNLDSDIVQFGGPVICLLSSYSSAVEVSGIEVYG